MLETLSVEWKEALKHQALDPLPTSQVYSNCHYCTVHYSKSALSQGSQDSWHK